MFHVTNYFSGAVKEGGALFEGYFYRDCFSSLTFMTCGTVTGADVFSLCGEVGQLFRIIIPERCIQRRIISRKIIISMKAERRMNAKC